MNGATPLRRRPPAGVRPRARGRPGARGGAGRRRRAAASGHGHARRHRRRPRRPRPRRAAPPDDYADLSDPRWGELRELVTAPAPAAPRRRPAWLRVLAPAAAIVLVLVAGVVGVQQLGDIGGNEAATSPSTRRPSGGLRGGGGAVQGDGTRAPRAATASRVARYGTPALDPAAYETIVVGKAPSTGGRPSALRGRPGAAGRRRPTSSPGEILRLDVVDRAVAPDRLVVLYLGRSPRPAPHAVTPAPAPSARRAPRGACHRLRVPRGDAYARQLPGDRTPATVTLP